MEIKQLVYEEMIYEYCLQDCGRFVYGSMC